jgi:hypothetical protein
MSLRYRTSLVERKRLENFYKVSEALVHLHSERIRESDHFDDDDLFGVPEIGLEPIHVVAIRQTIAYGNHIYAPLLDPTIDFDCSSPMLISDLSESVCISDFRFRKNHLQKLADLLWPRLNVYLKGEKDDIKVENGYRTPYETGFLILLYRMSYPRRVQPDMEKFFSMRKSKLSAILNTFLTAFYEVTLPYLSNPGLFYDRFNLYALAIKKKARVRRGRLRVWGFIDGTVRRICRPTYNQEMSYSGHKRCHGVKFQSVVTPDGLIACLYGPFEGCGHDARMLVESDIVQKLRNLMPVPEDDPQAVPEFQLYGDPAYSESGYLIKGFPNAPRGSAEARLNKKMSKVRECVEWGFRDVITYWSYLDYRRAMQLYKIPVAKYYFVGVFLSNCICLLQGNITSNYFAMHADDLLTIDKYIYLVNPEAYEVE